MFRYREGEKMLEQAVAKGADMNGIDTFHKYKVQNGQEYFFNKKTGRTLKIKKQFSSYLRAVK